MHRFNPDSNIDVQVRVSLLFLPKQYLNMENYSKEDKFNKRLFPVIKEMLLGATASFDVDTLGQELIETFVKFSNASRGSIFLYNNKTQELIMRGEVNHIPEYHIKEKKYIIKVHNKEKIGLTAYAYINEDSLLLNSRGDIENHPAHLGKYVEEKYGETDCTSILCIPLKLDNQKPIGVIKLENTIHDGQNNIFTEVIKEELEELAIVATEAIKNFELHSNKINTSISRVVDTVLRDDGNRSTDNNYDDRLHITLYRIANSISEIVNPDGVVVWIIEGSKLLCKLEIGLDDKNLSGKKYTLSRNLENSDRIGIIPYIAHYGENVSLKNSEKITNHPKYDELIDSAWYSKDSDISFIGSPLKILDRVCGVIHVYRRLDKKNTFTTEEIQLFSLIAKTASIIIQGEMQFERNNKYRQQLLALYKLGTDCYISEFTDEIFWNLLVGLTNFEGIGFNRVSLFKLEREGSRLYLKGIMGLGPKNKAEAIKNQESFDSGNKFNINYCKSLYPNNYDSSLNSFIKKEYISLNKDCDLYHHIKNKINKNGYPYEQISKNKCCDSIQNFLKNLDNSNDNFHAFTIIDIEENTYVGISETMYYHSKIIDIDSINAANTYLYQIKLALSRLSSLKKTKEETEAEVWRESTAITAHRIGTETAIIEGALIFLKDTLTQSNINNQWIEEMKDIEDSLGSLKRAVKDYSELHKLPSIKYQFIQPSDLLDQVAQDIEKIQSNRSKKVSIVKNYPSDLPSIYADYDCLVYVFKELCDNAVKSMPDGGTISISSDDFCGHDCISIHISDTGKGIRLDSLSQIYDAGFKDRSGGTGLGLYIVKKHIESHKGNISAKNNHDKGMIFSVMIPSQKFNKIDENKRILVIEDNATSCKQIVRAIIETYPNYEIHTAKNEHEAFNIISPHSSRIKNKTSIFDFIIADINLTETHGSPFGGLHLLQYISENEIDTKVILTTAYLNSMYIEPSGKEIKVTDKALELGVFEFIPRIESGKKFLHELVGCLSI